MRNLFLASAVLALLGTAPAYAGDDAGAKRLWASKCSNCHGDDGKAQTAKGKEMGIRDVTTAEWQKELTDEKIQKAIEDGIDTTKDGKKQKMDGYKDKLKPEQIKDLVKYMRSLAGK